MLNNTARQNMIEQQIRTWEVLDASVLALYADASIAREKFIPDAQQKSLAYADMALPIGSGQLMLEPKLEARMLQALAPRADEHILHIGCGSGFFAALLGKLAGTVVSVEIRPELAASAAARLSTVAPNVTVVEGDGAHGWAAAAPYDAIVLTGATSVLAEEFLAQTKDNGRVLAVVGSPPAMTLRLWHKNNGVVFLQHDILETDIPLLDNAPTAAAFLF
ncbi:MAG: protein-L-isoaspartate O-methyltransferase [Proteobacteria bacterium]|nr:protein-L-isoaspartate O-methyltransferase [Pseudomonadota bacterium]